MSFNKMKIDSELGIKIHQHLIECGVETPTIETNNTISEKIAIIEQKYTDIMNTLGLDLRDDSLVETPKRVAKMLVLDQFWGMDPLNFPKNTMIEDKMKIDEMVTVGSIQVNSVCEHHILPILGKAYVSYIAQGKVIGLSKLSRVVEYFCKRPQVQERLTSQIYHSLSYMLGTENVAVGIRAVHLCMTTRGVEDRNAWTQTTKLGGAFKTDPQTRSEFLRMIPND